MNTCMHSIIFRRPLFHLQSRLGGVCPYRSTISPRSFSILAVVLGGCLGERVEGGFVAGQEGRPVKRSPFRWLWVMMVFAEIYQFLDFGAAGPSAYPLFFVRWPSVQDVPPYRLSQDAGRHHPAGCPADLAGPTRCAKNLGTFESLAVQRPRLCFWLVRERFSTLCTRKSAFDHIYMIPQSRTQSSIRCVVYSRILRSR